MIKSKTAIELAFHLESLLRVLSLAAEGEQIAGKTFNASGGGNILDMAADMAGELVNQLDLAKTAQNVTA